ncbi:MAG: hypothetical protein JHC95_04315 [Solirubrobacteraceae bacterium]|nr:hypothetical protein [Solirubrobacteraceae bacterium]
MVVWPCVGPRPAEALHGVTVDFRAALLDAAGSWLAPQSLAGPLRSDLLLHSVDAAWRPDGTGLVSYGVGDVSMIAPGGAAFSPVSLGEAVSVGGTSVGFDVAGDAAVVVWTSTGFRWDPVFTGTLTGPPTGPLVGSLGPEEDGSGPLNARGDVITGTKLWSRRTAASRHQAIALGADPGTGKIVVGDDGGLLMATPATRPERLRVARVHPGATKVQSTALACGPVRVAAVARHGRRELVVAAIRGRLRAFWRLPDSGWRRVDVGADRRRDYVDAALAPSGDAILTVRTSGAPETTRVVTLADAAHTGRRSPRPVCR